MPLDDVLDDREAEPGAPRGAAAAGVGAVEPPGQVRDLFRSDPVALIGDRDARLPIGRAVKLDPDRRSGTGIFQRVFHKVAHNLFELLAIALDPGGLDDGGPKALGMGRACRIARGGLDELAQIEQIARGIVLFGLHPAQAHEVADQALEALRFALDSAQKFLGGGRIKAVRAVRKRFNIAQDRRERRPQFVARIGDEIGVRAADIGLGGLVDELDHRHSSIERVAIEVPDILAAHQPVHDHRTVGFLIEQLDRFGLAEGDPRILTDDVLAEHQARGAIGDRDRVALGDEQRSRGVLDQLAHRFAPLGFAHDDGGLFGWAYGRDQQRADPNAKHRKGDDRIDLEQEQRDERGERQDDAGEGNGLTSSHKCQDL